MNKKIYRENSHKLVAQPLEARVMRAFTHLTHCCVALVPIR